LSKDNPSLLEKIVTKVAVLQSQVDDLRTDVRRNTEHIEKVHKRINTLVTNELKHYKGMSKKEKAVIISVPTLISLLTFILYLIQSIG